MDTVDPVDPSQMNTVKPSEMNSALQNPLRGILNPLKGILLKPSQMNPVKSSCQMNTVQPSQRYTVTLTHLSDGY